MLRHFLLFASFCAAFCQLGHAQIWLEVGPKANFGPSGFLNSAILDDAEHDYSLNLAFSYGGALGLNVGDLHGLNLEVMTGTYFQTFTFRPSTDMRIRNTVEWEVLDLYALYRFYPKNGMYLELGPKFTRINEVKHTQGVDELPVTGNYVDDYLSGVIGIGAFLAGSETMIFKSGLRFEYGFSDLISADGMAAGFPSVGSTITDQGVTTPIRVSFGFEVSFGLGGIAQGACGRRGFVLGSKFGG